MRVRIWYRTTGDNLQRIEILQWVEDGAIYLIAEGCDIKNSKWHRDGNSPHWVPLNQLVLI